MYRKVLPFLVAVLAAAQQPRSDEPGNPVAGDPGAIESGRKTYVGSCAGCHGATGEGGRGPNLRDGRLIRRSSDAQMFRTIQKGIAGTEMPGTNLPDTRIWELVAFVRGLGSPAAFVMHPGDAAKGAEVFAKNGCGACHSIGGQGGTLGPDLSTIGGLRSYEYLREAIVKPGDRVAAGFQKIVAKTKDGRVIEGVVKNYSNYEVQMVDRTGKLYLFRTPELADVKIAVETWMPQDYGKRIGRDEMTDLLAYLSRLSSRPVKLGGGR
ncbi:MAG: c-type cytochrome [Acidobacteria bacterium]|nr:c-type cytochrome [Acidobacteriota bacterium]